MLDHGSGASRVHKTEAALRFALPAQAGTLSGCCTTGPCAVTGGLNARDLWAGVIRTLRRAKMDIDGLIDAPERA